jgi:hypothetical protein
VIEVVSFEQRSSLYPDAAAYREQMEGKTWEQLDPVFFARRSDALSFLGTQHLVAVLPTYLHLLIVLAPTSPVAETLLPQLTKPSPTDHAGHLFDELGRRFDELARMLSPQQSAVVAMTLRQFIEAAPGEAERARPALERYWHTFAS